MKHTRATIGSSTMPRDRARLRPGIALALGFAAIGFAAAGCGDSEGANGPAQSPPADGPPTPQIDEGKSGFVEVAKTARLQFHNTFLEGEQGANFKINLYDHGSGVCAVDYDADGWDDILLLNQLGTNALFRNHGDGTFENVTKVAGVGLPDRICTSACFGDYDNDGDQDLYVATTRAGNVLLRNDGSGKFEDVSAAAGVGLVAHTQGVAFLDYDNDGDLDLFLTNTAKWTMDRREPKGRYYEGAVSLQTLVASEIEHNVMYRNEGDGTFSDVTAALGLEGPGWGGDIVGLDADDDGFLDLMVTNMFGQSRIYHNEGGRRFVDVTEKSVDVTSWGAVGANLIDHDVDGLLDVILIDMHSDMWMESLWGAEEFEETRKYDSPVGPLVERGVMSEEKAQEMWAMVAGNDERVVYGTTLLRNLSGGNFEDVSERAGVETLWPWGAAVADFDASGAEDIFIPTGMGYPYTHWRNALLMNRGDGRFDEVGAKHGIEPRPEGEHLPIEINGRRASRSSRCAAVLDFDRDGRMDLVVNNFNERPYLYRNTFPKRNWVGFRLRGTHCNRDAVGARVYVESAGRKQVRQITPVGGYLAQSTRTLHFGLGDGATIEKCTVVWPDGTRQDVPGVAVGKVHDVVEAKPPR